MSGVDVLAALDDAARTECGWGDYPLANRLTEARAAVAELIDAAEAVARIQINRRSPANDLGKAKQVRLRAALSRVRGAE